MSEHPRKGAHRLVVNLSKHFSISPSQSSLLMKGLTFIPSVQKMKDFKHQLRLDLQKYHRRIKLEVFFEGKKTKKQRLPFTHNSDWTPALSRLPKQVGQLITADEYAFKNLNWNLKPRPNLQREELRALNTLKNLREIVIKPADKGNAIVIMDREQYVWEGERQLNISDHYKPLEKPIYLETMKQIRKILEQMYDRGIINSKQREYLSGSGTPRMRRFYLLPKIHKEPEKWSIPHEIPPGRPIVSDCNSETYQTAEYIEYFLNPISQKHPSYLKDTYDFIQKVKDISVPSGAFLFTIDIDSLYTNIETEAGLQAVRECMLQYPDPKRPDDYILKLLDINLNKNDFEFNSKYYLQVKGTAMGKKFAPSYANIFMAKWEQSALDSCTKKPLYYYRFLDDIWGVWSYSMDDFKDFAEHLNAHQKSIKIKYTIDLTEVNFLDVVSYKGQKFENTGQLDFKVYFKETDTHSLLHKHSFHPKHTFKGIVKSQLLRFYRICSEHSCFMEATKILFRALRDRGYSRSFLRRALKTFLLPRTPGDPTQKEKNKIIPLVSNFSSMSKQLNRAAKSNFERFFENTPYLQKHKQIAAYRRNTNLADILVNSKLRPMAPQTRKLICKYFDQKKWVFNRSTKQVFQVSQQLTPITHNCIYLIYCAKCSKQYVGQTKNALRTRVYQHTHNIKNKIEKRRHVVQHFLTHGLEAFRVTGLQSDPFWSLCDRLKFERLWIMRLDTKFPRGLNET